MPIRLLTGLIALCAGPAGLFAPAVANAAAVDAAPTTQPTTPVVGMAELQAALKSARPGDVVQTPFTDTTSVRPLALQISPVAGGPQFLLSDKPEYFRTGDGIAMQEDVQPGAVRLYLYHVPEPTGQPKVISAVIENLGDAPMTLRYSAVGAAKPGGDYHAIARGAMVAFLKAQADAPRMAEVYKSQAQQVAPRGRVVIDPYFDATPVTTDQLVHGIYEFSIDQPARVTVFQKSPSADSLTVIDTLPPLPRVLPGHHASGAGRGLFATCELSVTSAEPIDTRAGPALILVADGKTDPWIEGRDSLDPSTSIQNKGNYGVMYRMQFRYASPDGRRLALLMAGHRPDNKWCRYTSAAVRVDDGVHPGGVVALPREEKRFDGLPQAVVMQVFPPAPAGETREIRFTYSPPGACCLPTPIFAVPVD